MDADERPVTISQGLGDIFGSHTRVRRVESKDEHAKKTLLRLKKAPGQISVSGARVRVDTAMSGREGVSLHNDSTGYGASVHIQRSRYPSRSPHLLWIGSAISHRDCGWPPKDIATKMATSVKLVNSVQDRSEQMKRIVICCQSIDKLYE